MKALLIAAALLAGCHSQAYYDEIAQRRFAIAEQKAQQEAEREKQKEEERIKNEQDRKINEQLIKTFQKLPPEYWLTRQAPVRYHPMTCPVGMVPDRDICIYRTW